ncbi:conjugative transfer signal peptidase TraF [Azonexus sp.]|uniref:conjugative transfer signal peptidase TraF n=1 Tax=Azonexus sp. TaxID=1872668 RepID=UPI0039E4A7B1
MAANFKVMRWPLAGLALVFALVAGVKTAGVKVNVTGSLPGTVYTTSAEPGLGDFIQFCPPVTTPALPAAGWLEKTCPGGKLPLLKRVVAVEGDIVDVTESGVAVNGRLLENSVPKKASRNGDPLPVAYGQHRIVAGQIWTAGEHPDSFDSRYFGSVNVYARTAGSSEKR